MKKERLFIFWLLAIIIASVLLIFLKPQQTINNVIQAIAIITLVFVTWIYAKRTKDLVEQEKISLEEEKKIRNANFGEKRLKDFFFPILKELDELKRQIGKPVIDYNPFSKTVRSISNLLLDSFHLSSIEDKGKLGELNEILYSVHEDVKKGELEEETKQIILTKIDKLSKFLREKMFEIEVNIEKVYEFFSG